MLIYIYIDIYCIHQIYVYISFLGLLKRWDPPVDPLPLTMISWVFV